MTFFEASLSPDRGFFANRRGSTDEKPNYGHVFYLTFEKSWYNMTSIFGNKQEVSSQWVFSHAVAKFCKVLKSLNVL